MDKFIKVISALIVLLAVWSSLMSSSSANDETKHKNKALVDSLNDGDIEEFERLLESGSDPTGSIGSGDFKSSSLCKSTEIGYEAFFHSIANNGVDLDYLSSMSAPWSSAINCAILNKNYSLIEDMYTRGVDINKTQNPEVENKIFLRSPLHYALQINEYRIAWFIVQRIETSPSQEALILRKLTKRGGIEGHPQLPFRRKLAEWLREQGYEFSSPAPSTF